VEDFSPSDDLEAALHDALARAAAAAGFSMERHRLDVVGTCPACE
jgi:Fe2+ or Zn2+ uptake regulation protein